MDNPGLEAALWSELDGRLWHATSPTAWNQICADGAIRVRDLRYRNAFSKYLQGVSLFDFGPTATDCQQLDNWWGWLGRQQGSRTAVWLEIDRQSVAGALIDAGAMLREWHASQSYSRRFIPGVEACHRGDLPLSAFVGALMIGRDHDHPFWSGPATSIDVAGFEASLKPANAEHPILEALRKNQADR